MPNPINPATAGLQTAMAPEAQINERMGVRAKLAAMGGQMPQPAPLPQAPQQFQMNPQLPDPNGMIAALKSSGYTGQRMDDIALPEDPQSVAQLKARIDALMGGGR